LCRVSWLFSVARSPRAAEAPDKDEATGMPIFHTLAADRPVVQASRRGAWETPRAILMIVVATAVVAGVLGWWVGHTPPRPTVIQVVIQVVGRPT
jgi:hypothetical protein